MKQIFLIFAVMASVALTSACSAPPHVHKPGQYNRAAAGFGQPVTDLDRVTVCYSSYSATPTQVRKMAAQECARFNKTAEFVKQNYQTCPLTAPVAAEFNCVGDGISGKSPGGFPRGL